MVYLAREMEGSPGRQANVSGFSHLELLLLLGLMIPSTMVLVDSGMLSVALPVIQDEFGVSVDLLALVVAAVYVPRVALMPVFGQLGDLFGKKRLYLWGLSIYTLGAGVGIIATSFPILLLARLMQGVGAASIPLAIALILDSFPRERSGRALGTWNSASPLGTLLGPLLGGIVVERLGWHANFVIVLFFSLLAAFAVWRLVPAHPVSQPAGYFDWTGAFFLVGAMLALLLASSTTSVFPLGSPVNVAFWVVGGLGLLGLAWNALRRPRPLVGFEIFKNPRFLLPSVAVNLRMFAHTGTTFLLVLYLANVFRMSPSAVGFFTIFYTLALLVGIVYGGTLADRWPSRKATTLGLLAQGLGLLGIGWVGTRYGVYGMVPGMLVAGFGAGSCLISFTKEAVVALGDEKVGLASGLYNMLRFAGATVSAPVLGSLLAAAFLLPGGSPSLAGPYVSGFRLLALAAGGGLLLARFIPLPVRKSQVEVEEIPEVDV